MENSGDAAELFRSLSQINLIQIILVVVGAWLLIALGQRSLVWLANRLFIRHRLFLLAWIPVLRLSFITIAFVVILLRLIEPTFENLVTLLGALGVALGFAFKDYASSLIAGVVTLFEMPYRPGDWIEIDGVYGEVQNINLRSAEILTPDDNLVIIPHLKLWDQLISNANNGGEKLLCIADFFLNPRHDANQITQVLYDVALTSTFVQIQQPIKVIVVGKPWGIHYRLKAYPIDPRQQFHFVTDLTIRGNAILNSLGVEFAMISDIRERDE